VKTSYLLILMCQLLAVHLLAQQEELPQADAFFGFTSLSTGSTNTILAKTSLGGLGTIGFNINEHIGIEAEFGGYHNGFVDAFHDDTISATYLFGPRVSYGRTKRIDPYFHGLVGGIHTGTSVLVQPLPTPFVAATAPRSNTTQNAFAIAIGGGVDIKLNRYISFRPAQVDYFTTKLGSIGPAGLATSRFQSDFRYAIGFVFNINDP
jgi:hypothetical protein